MPMRLTNTDCPGILWATISGKCAKARKTLYCLRTRLARTCCVGTIAGLQALYLEVLVDRSDYFLLFRLRNPDPQRKSEQPAACRHHFLKTAVGAPAPLACRR